MPNPARHGGIVTVHIGPIPSDRYVIAPNGKVMKSTGTGWRSVPGLAASVVRAWPADISPKARSMTTAANAQAAHIQARARARETPLQAKVRRLRESRAR